MKKAEVLNGLNEVQIDLNKVNEKLKKLLFSPIWSEEVDEELDDTIRILQNQIENVARLMEIQHKIMMKK